MANTGLVKEETRIVANNHVFSLQGTITFTTSEARGMRHRAGFWQVPKPLTSLNNRVGITAELPDCRHL
ncbi:MAG: hypothetical protein QGF99_08530, partial [Acidimicrobiales bacterium]|nr:hypothetical protein [Acidimicrobiales bacterium]